MKKSFKFFAIATAVFAFAACNNTPAEEADTNNVDTPAIEEVAPVDTVAIDTIPAEEPVATPAKPAKKPAAKTEEKVDPNAKPKPTKEAKENKMTPVQPTAKQEESKAKLEKAAVSNNSGKMTKKN